MNEQGEQNTVANPIAAPGHPAQRHFWPGAVTSMAYVGGLAIYSWHEWAHMRAMTPDQFATFLSGAFAPLAFLWLVLGFRQQGDELQNSARALYLQGEELRNSVEQQRRLVEVSREQLEAERAQRDADEQAANAAAQPRLVVTQTGHSRYGAETVFHLQYGSAGPTCTDVLITANGKAVAELPMIGAVQGIGLNLSFSSLDEISETHLQFFYADARGRRGSQCFIVPLVTTNGEGSPPTLGQPSQCFAKSHSWHADQRR